MSEQACVHEVLQSDICLQCGAYVDPSAEADRVYYGEGLVRTKVFTGTGPSGVVLMSASALEQHLVQTSNTLLLKRKLMLVLDLDHTIVHAAKAPRFMLNAEGHVDKQALNHFYPPVSKSGVRGADDVQVVELTMVVNIRQNDPIPRGGVVIGHGTDSNSVTTGGMPTRQVRLPDPHLVKFRPGVRRFLKDLSQHYEIFVYTMGTREYADAVVGLVDPDATSVRRPVVSGVELGERVVKRLDALLPCDRRLSVVLDDRVDVWRGFESHVLQIREYAFFPASLGFEEAYNRLAMGAAAAAFSSSQDSSEKKASEGGVQQQAPRPQAPKLTPTNAQLSDPDRVLPSVLMTLRALHDMFYEKIDEEVSQREKVGLIPPAASLTGDSSGTGKLDAPKPAAPKRKLPSHVVAKMAKDAQKAQEAHEEKLVREREAAERQRRSLNISQLPDLASVPLVLRALRLSVFSGLRFVLSGIVPRRNGSELVIEAEEELRIPLVRSILECGGEASTSRYVLYPNDGDLSSLSIDYEKENATHMLATSPFTEKVNTTRKLYSKAGSSKLPPILHPSFIASSTAHWMSANERLFNIFDSSIWIAKATSRPLPEQVQQSVTSLKSSEVNDPRSPLLSALSVPSMGEWWTSLQVERLHRTIDSAAVNRANMCLIARLKAHAASSEKLEQISKENMSAAISAKNSIISKPTNDTLDSIPDFTDYNIGFDSFDWDHFLKLSECLVSTQPLSFVQACSILSNPDLLCDEALHEPEVKRICQAAWTALDVENGKIMLREEQMRIAMEQTRDLENLEDEDHRMRLAESLALSPEELAELENVSTDCEDEGEDEDEMEGNYYIKDEGPREAHGDYSDEEAQDEDEDEEEEEEEKPRESYGEDLGHKRKRSGKNAIDDVSKRVQRTEDDAEVWDDIEF